MDRHYLAEGGGIEVVGIIEVRGLGESEKAAGEILEHVEAIKRLQKVFYEVGVNVVLTDEGKEEITSGN